MPMLSNAAVIRNRPLLKLPSQIPASPNDPDDVKLLSEVAGAKITVFIGSA